VQWLRDSGWPSAEIVRLPGVLPYVIAEDRRAGPDAPTLLLYAHHDVQPPLGESRWASPPFTPTIREGRMFGRGAADDKAGIALHAAAMAAWCAVAGRPPINLVAVIEGEEEIGSPHFSRFLAAHRQRLKADAVVIADLANVAVGVPSLTTSLRGHVTCEVEVRALAKPLHSGMWGGAVPDPIQALCRMLGSLTAADGTILVDGLCAGAATPTAAQQAGCAAAPYEPADFAEQAGLVGGAATLPAAGTALYERLWLRPSLTVTAIQSGERGRTGNVVMDAAWARIGLRTVPGMEATRCMQVLDAHLRASAPAGCTVTITPGGHGSAWATDTTHPLFACAHRALAAGYGRAAVEIGCGASIPFVQEVTAALGGVPAILVGVEDPACGAHAENESVHLGDLRAAIRAEAALFAEVAAWRR
jgi:acetylornithine deacetylase/succinyl-diaminopimelate desuccinylase-like protein